MKNPTRSILALVLLPLTAAFADMTRYGFSGINFVPSEEKSFGPDISAGYFLGVRHSGESDVYPRGLCLMTSLQSFPVEIGLSNTYSLASGSNQDGFRPGVANDYLPVVPTLKYVLGETPTAWGQWRMATGFAMPYGAYFVGGFKSAVPFLQPHVSAGLSSRYNAYHIFGGMALRIADGAGRPLPLYFTSDFALGNSLELLDQVEEKFYSLGVRMDAGQHLELGMVYRADGKYPRFQNEGTVAFSVTAHFNPISRRTRP
jgi:hypothetical protein